MMAKLISISLPIQLPILNYRSPCHSHRQMHERWQDSSCRGDSADCSHLQAYPLNIRVYSRDVYQIRIGI
jgi:hypothetical protein